MLTRMLLQCLFLQLLIISFALPNTASSATATTSLKSISTADIITRSGCQSKCGNLTVPYPFGIGLGSRCSIGAGFDINCNNSFNPPKAFIGAGNVEVVNIANNAIRIKNVVAFNCFNQQGNNTAENEISIDLSETPFTFSDANRFTIVGCDDLAQMVGTQGQIERPSR